MSDNDPTGVITGNVQKIASHLYTLVLTHDKLIECSFTTTLKAHYLETFYEIANELEKPIYHEGKRVITIVMKYFLSDVSYHLLYRKPESQDFLVRWFMSNLDLLFFSHNSYKFIKLLFLHSSLVLFTTFVTSMCANITYSNKFFNILGSIFQDWIKEQMDFIDRVSFLEKTLIIIEQDYENKLKVAWDFIVMIIGQEPFEEEEEQPLSVEGFVFLNSKRLNRAKAKYLQQNAYDEMLQRVGEIHDIIKELDIVHQGVDNILMGYL